MNLFQLCEKIELQPEVEEKVMEYSQNLDFETIRDDLEKLKNMKTEKEARLNLTQKLPDDTDHIKMLTCMLLRAVDLYRMYKEKGIDEQIYIDTMKCFTRFISECKENTGVYAFDRDFWTARQISGVLFRIGELEYEMKKLKNKPAVSIHIPSDSSFTDDKCSDSLSKAKLFFGRYFEGYDECDYFCESWLLMPELKNFLRKDSNIVKFQERFDVKDFDYSDSEYIQWIFKTNDKNCNFKNLPEKTSLQRNLKRHLLNGGKFGAAFGILKK